MSTNLSLVPHGQEPVEGVSVVDALLDIQKYQVESQKSIEWAETLECLSIENHRSRLLKLASKPAGDRDYIAVSHAWKYSRHRGSGLSGSYAVRRTSAPPKPSLVRDEVLARIISYAKYCGVRRFWIDIECINQQNKEEHHTAMNSMDLVYSGSDYPLGLLETVLDTQEKVNLLQRLVSGDFTSDHNSSERPVLSRKVERNRRTLRGTLKLLSRLERDQWWHRAWIFQEEYRSSVNMNLLIRHEPGLKKTAQFGNIPNEMFMSVIDLRKQATRFLLACRDNPRAIRSPRTRLQERIPRMQQTFARYHVIHKHVSAEKKRAMSALIFGDVGRRRVGHEFDLLPILANSCHYDRRLDMKKLEKKGHSLSLCLLAMYLINGELIKNTLEINSPPARYYKQFCQELRSIAFDQFDPCIWEGHLTYLKTARFPNVSFSEQGLCTTGILWQVCDTVRTSKMQVDAVEVSHIANPALNEFQRKCLKWLVCQLKSQGGSYSRLCDRILKLADTCEPLRTPAQEHRLRMAERVVEAIREGRRLYVAQHVESEEPRAVFTDFQHDTQYLLTAWDRRHLSHDRVQDTYVSLVVKVEDTTQPPKVRSLQWISGLAFFSGEDQFPVVFPWPRAWTERTRGIGGKAEVKANLAHPSNSKPCRYASGSTPLR